MRWHYRSPAIRRLAQLVAVRGAEVDLVFHAVEAEADGAVRLAAIEVINEQRLNSLKACSRAAPNQLPTSHVPTRASAIPAVCDASAACLHVVTALLPATVTSAGHSSAEAQGPAD